MIAFFNKQNITSTLRSHLAKLKIKLVINKKKVRM